MINVQSLLIISFCFLNPTLYGQTKFLIEKGQISFDSNAKLEIISAKSNNIRGAIDQLDNRFAFVVKTQSFEGFNADLQRQHFNERYLETDKFFEATFSGKIIDDIDFTKNGSYEVRAKGNFVLHGKKQIRIIKGRITVTGDVLTIDSEFIVPLSDHDIAIPRIVSEKIATEVNVKLTATMKRAISKV